MRGSGRPPSSSGLGYLVLSQRTGVRIPLGVVRGAADNGCQRLLSFVIPPTCGDSPPLPRLDPLPTEVTGIVPDCPGLHRVGASGEAPRLSVPLAAATVRPASGPVSTDRSPRMDVSQLVVSLSAAG